MCPWLLFILLFPDTNFPLLSDGGVRPTGRPVGRTPPSLSNGKFVSGNNNINKSQGHIPKAAIYLTGPEPLCQFVLRFKDYEVGSRSLGLAELRRI